MNFQVDGVARSNVAKHVTENNIRDGLPSLGTFQVDPCVFYGVPATSLDAWFEGQATHDTRITRLINLYNSGSRSDNTSTSTSTMQTKKASDV